MQLIHISIWSPFQKRYHSFICVIQISRIPLIDRCRFVLSLCFVQCVPESCFSMPAGPRYPQDKGYKYHGTSQVDWSRLTLGGFSFPVVKVLFRRQ